MKRWNSLEIFFFVAFLLWGAVGLTSTLLHITPASFEGHVIGPVKDFIALCFAYGDPILILLAFANTHLHAARQWSSGIARRWAMLLLLCAYGVEYLGSQTGLPFGSYHYTTNFGPLVEGVPLTIPLAWHVVVTNALFVVRAVAPHLSQFVEALVAGFLCMAYDFILEPFATTVKHYWNWQDGSVPPLNYLAWLLISALMIRILAPTVTTKYRLDPRPWLILALTLAIFIASRLGPAS